MYRACVNDVSYTLNDVTIITAYLSIFDIYNLQIKLNGNESIIECAFTKVRLSVLNK